MSLLDKLKKSSTVKESGTLSDSKFFSDKDETVTELPILNLAFSGDIEGGFRSGLTQFAGPSKHFKTTLALFCIKAYLDKHKDAVCLYYDSEFGAPPEYLAEMGIDTARILHTPVMDVEELKFDMTKQLNTIARGDKAIIFIDSVGNLASKKEAEDALDAKSVADMSRAKAIKSMFRIATPHFTMKDIPCIAINHTIQTMEMFSKQVVTGGCVVKGTKIKTPTGLKPVEDFVPGDKVTTLEGTNTVTHVWNPSTLEVGTPECYEVTFVDDYSVICSDKHKFLLEGDNRTWVEAQDLESGQEIVTDFNGVIAKVASVNAIGRREVYDLSVEEVEHYVLENGVVTHNTGIYYSSDNVFILGRAQEKVGKDIVGYNFTINIDKSRFVREKSKFPLNVTFDMGINKWSGLLQIAIDLGFVESPKQGWYTRVTLADEKTGEMIDDKNWRAKESNCEEFWAPLLADDNFKIALQRRYKVAMAADEDEIDVDDVEGMKASTFNKIK